MTNAIKKFKAVGIVVSILVILAGIFMFTRPVGTGIIFAWTAMAFMLVNGIYRIARYFGIPKEARNGWMLADGIISVIVAVWILVEIFAKPFAGTLGLVVMLGYIAGFYQVFAGITQLCTSGKAKELGASSGWMIFLGIVNILCGLFVMSHPIVSYFAFEWVSGIYLCIFGITTLIECICMKKEA